MRSKVKTGVVDIGTLERAIDNTHKVLKTVIQNASKNITNAQAMKGNTSALVADLNAMEALYANEVEAAEAKENERVKALAAAKRAAEAKEKAPKITKPQEVEAVTPSAVEAK
jgi:septal ring factor EnvC (AmiA/AmiB activator)